MPTITELKIPPPTNWEELERIAVSALKIRWCVTELTRYGRSGQHQDGVDLFGFTRSQDLYGVQCKNTEELLLGAVEQEVAKAEGFQPHLDAYFIVTTAVRDVKLQQSVLKGPRMGKSVDCASEERGSGRQKRSGVIYRTSGCRAIGS